MPRAGDVRGKRALLAQTSLSRKPVARSATAPVAYPLYWTADDCCDPFWWSGYGRRLEGTFASLGANGLHIDQRPPQSRAQMRELRAVWAQAARVEAMRAARRAAEAEADDEATDDEAEAAAEEDELLLGCI